MPAGSQSPKETVNWKMVVLAAWVGCVEVSDMGFKYLSHITVKPDFSA